MARKSEEANVTVAVNNSKNRPAPPSHLTAEERAVWKAVVDAKTADWFTPENFPLLELYCQNVVLSRRLAKELTFKLDPKMFTMKNMIEKTIANLATKMRLTQQSRWQPHGAARKANQGGVDADGNLPWSDGDCDGE